MRGPAPGGLKGIGLNDGSPKVPLSPAQERVNKAKAMGPDLSGLVAVKPFEVQYTSEVPSVSCQLFTTHLDYLKILRCREDKVRHLKLTSDASDRLEMEKQV